jgi:hypothetical protein
VEKSQNDVFTIKSNIFQSTPDNTKGHKLQYPTVSELPSKVHKQSYVCKWRNIILSKTLVVCDNKPHPVFGICINGLVVKTHRCTLNSQVKAMFLERNLV